MLVILADKDPQDLDALASSLSELGREVVTATDGRAVVAIATERSPEAVVVCASLGSMGGFAVSRHLKTIAAAGEIGEPKIVVLLEREADTWLAAWSRCDAWLCKPVEPAEVAELLGELLTPTPAPA